MIFASFLSPLPGYKGDGTKREKVNKKIKKKIHQSILNAVFVFSLQLLWSRKARPAVNIPARSPARSQDYGLL